MITIQKKQLELITHLEIVSLVSGDIERRLYRIENSIKDILERVRRGLLGISDDLIEIELSKKVPVTVLQLLAIEAKVNKGLDKALKRVKKEILKDIGNAFKEECTMGKNERKE